MHNNTFYIISTNIMHKDVINYPKPNNMNKIIFEIPYTNYYK